jgi:hypothetical protein
MAGRFIDKLKAAANLTPTKKVVTLANGEEVEFYSTPMTASERERAKKDARSEDPAAFALQLLVRKAQDAQGRRLFNPGDVADLKTAVRDDDLQNLLLAVLGSEEAEEDDYDMKSDSD